VSFEVPVSSVSRSRAPRGVLAVVAVSVLIVVGALGASLAAPGPPAQAPPRAVAAAPPTASTTPDVARVTTVPTPRFEPASFTRPLPTTIDCHGLATTQCRRLVRAALRILPDDLPGVGWAGAWPSLVCNDNFDCPTTYLADGLPAGSVVVGFDDGSRAVTVNVVDWQPSPSIRLGLRAWLVPMT
jgi:hypothetical protein